MSRATELYDRYSQLTADQKAALKRGEPERALGLQVEMEGVLKEARREVLGDEKADHEADGRPERPSHEGGSLEGPDGSGAVRRKGP